MKNISLEVPRSLTEIVGDKIRQAILDGDIALGEMISEERLAQSFGISRTPVRDALTSMQSTGLIVIRPKRGTFVFRPAEQDILAISEFRVVMETHAAKLSYANNKALMLMALQAAQEEMEKAHSDGDFIRYCRYDSTFHEALFEHCGNDYIRKSYELASWKIAAIRMEFGRQFSQVREASVSEHREIINLINKGDFNAVEALLKLHVSVLGELSKTMHDLSPSLN